MKLSLKMEFFIATAVRASILKQFNLVYIFAFSFLEDQYYDRLAGKNKNIRIGP
jgi:hypothetical protein